MRRNRIIFDASDYALLSGLMASGGKNEAAAFLLCRESLSAEGATLVVKEVLEIDTGDILSATPSGMAISSRAVTRALKAAAEAQCSFVFIHSHPEGHPDFSQQDDEQEEKLFSTAHVRVDRAIHHGSLVWSQGRITAGRVWTKALLQRPITRVNIIGTRFAFYGVGGQEPIPAALFDRQVLAFGKDIQSTLQGLHVGIVGVGGTGSATLEQVVRLGVGTVSIFDSDTFDRTNANRVYGSGLGDQGRPKVDIAERLVRSIGFGTDVRSFASDIGIQATARGLRDCDVIFGCTDDELGRSILTRLALAYRIPVFDMGVKIDAREDFIRAIEARVTTLMPGEACLFCRGRITGEGVSGDAMRKFQPEAAEELEKEGYLAGAGTPAPSVIPFTTMIASTAVTELLHRLTGILGDERVSSEVLCLIQSGQTRTNRRDRRPDCFCSDSGFIGSADRKPFLDTVWPLP